MEAGAGCVGVRGGCAAISMGTKALLSLGCSLAYKAQWRADSYDEYGQVHLTLILGQQAKLKQLAAKALPLCLYWLAPP